MDFKIKEVEIEKDDKKFKEALIRGGIAEKKEAEGIETKRNTLLMNKPKRNTQKKVSSIESKEIKAVFKENLTPVQRELFFFIQQKTREGRDLKSIENLLEQGLSENLYTFSDVLTAINEAMKERLQGGRKFKKSQSSGEKTLSEDDKRFINFLKEHPDHSLNTVSLYKAMGFSTRKGNVIKKRLIDKGILSVQEVRSEKGWQKFIRLSKNL